MALEYRYVSTYGTARGTSEFISAIGWIVVVLSGAGLVFILTSIAPGVLQVSISQAFGMFTGGGALAAGGTISGLLLVAIGQFSRAALDSADHSGEMLAIMQEHFDARNTALANIPSFSLRPRPSTQAPGPTGREVEPLIPRVVEIPPGVENQKLSIREAAQSIGVTTATLRGYIYAGRLPANPDDTIDLYALYHAGFIVRNLPQKETRP